MKVLIDRQNDGRKDGIDGTGGMVVVFYLILVKLALGTDTDNMKLTFLFLDQLLRDTI